MDAPGDFVVLDANVSYPLRRLPMAIFPLV